MNQVEFENISYNFIMENNNSTVRIIKENIDFYIKLNIKDGKNYLIAFSNGAFDPDRSTPPIFMRSKWSEDFEASCIFIDDRTVHNSDLTIGWGIGSKDRYYIEDYSEIIRKITKILEVSSEHVIYYGSSAGGYMSIALASYHKGSIAIANNPQTYVHRYNRLHVNKLLNTIFHSLSKENVMKKYAKRFSLNVLMTKNKNVPKTIYLQNRLCKSDVEQHLKPFLLNCDKYKLDISNINFIMYSNKYSGHSPIGREKSVNFINNLIKSDFSTII